MKKQVFRIEKDGFHGAWYPASVPAKRGFILMLGDDSEDYLASCGAKWLNEKEISVMAMSPDKKDYGHHSYPLERFGKALAFMKGQGCESFGIVGASTTGMMALLAASYYPEISLTIAISPPDFVMEGFYRDNKDGATERPGDYESSVTWQGKELPFLPYAIRNTGRSLQKKRKQAVTAPPQERCSMNRKEDTLCRKRKRSKSRRSAEGSSASARKTTYYGIPAAISGGWRSVFRKCRMRAPLKPGSMNTGRISLSRNPC